MISARLCCVEVGALTRARPLLLSLRPSTALMAAKRSRPKTGGALSLEEMLFEDCLLRPLLMLKVYQYGAALANQNSENERSVSPPARAGAIARSTHTLLAVMQPEDIAQVKARVQARMTADAQGRISHTARANAIKGRVPV